MPTEYACVIQLCCVLFSACMYARGPEPCLPGPKQNKPPGGPVQLTPSALGHRHVPCFSTRRSRYIADLRPPYTPYQNNTTRLATHSIKTFLLIDSDSKVFNACCGRGPVPSRGSLGTCEQRPRELVLNLRVLNLRPSQPYSNHQTTRAPVHPV